MENKSNHDSSVEILEIAEIEALIIESDAEIQEPQDISIEKEAEEEEKKLDYIPFNVEVSGDFKLYDKHKQVIDEEDFSEKFHTRI